MFKFICDGNFDKTSTVYRQIDDSGNIIIDRKENLTTMEPSALASTSDYLYDIYPNGNRDYTNTIFRGKNIIDFPEIKDASSCLTTNDGLVIFNYNVDNGDDYCIVYDLVYDNNTIFNDIDVDIQNHIDLIKYCKYTSPRVHRLDIVDGKVKPDIKFIDSKNTYHFFVDCDLNTDTYPLDEYGYYTCTAENTIDISEITFNKKGKILVSTVRFYENMPCNSEHYYKIIDDSNEEVISFNISSIENGIYYICY